MRSGQRQANVMFAAVVAKAKEALCETLEAKCEDVVHRYNFPIAV